MIAYSCAKCNAALHARDDWAGQKVLCPICAQRLQIPLPPTNKTILAPLTPPQTGPPVAQFAPIEKAVAQGPPVRCWDCGKFFAVEKTCRRDVTVGHSSFSTATADPFDPIHGRRDSSTSSSHSGRVDLCLECATRRDERMRAMVWTMVLIAAGLLGYALIVLLIQG